MKKIKTYILALALIFVANVGISQFVTGDFNEVVEYCHIDLLNGKDNLHRDFTEKITITKDSMNIKLNMGQELNYVLGDFVYLPNARARAIRIVTNVEHPETSLMAMYIQDELVSIRNMETGATVWFFLKNICEKLEKLPSDGWFEKKEIIDKKTD